MFLPVGENTVIDEIFEDFEADDRIDEVFVSTNERFADAFADYLTDSPFKKPTLSVEETVEEDEKFGVVGALAQLVVERENVDDDLIVVAGDNMISFDLSDFADFFESKGTPTLAAYDVGTASAPSPTARRSRRRRGHRLPGEARRPKKTLVSIACYAFPAETLPDLSTYLEDGNNPDEPGWFLQWLQKRGAVHAYTFDGAWFDIGTADSYLDAVEYALDGGTLVADDAIVENSDLGDVVHVMSGATVTDSTLERAVVFPNVTITDSEIRNP